MIVLTWDNANSRADISRSGGPIHLSSSLETAVILSLFCWRTRDLDALPLPGQERRGYWGDAFETDDKWGSGLWQLMVTEGRNPRTHGGRISAEFMELASNEIKAALQWMLDDGVASAIDVEVERWNRDRLAFRTSIHKPDGETYSEHWEATLAAA